MPWFGLSPAQWDELSEYAQGVLLEECLMHTEPEEGVVALPPGEAPLHHPGCWWFQVDEEDRDRVWGMLSNELG